MWIAEASSVVLETKVGKTILLTALGASTCQAVKDVNYALGK